MKLMIPVLIVFSPKTEVLAPVVATTTQPAVVAEKPVAHKETGDCSGYADIINKYPWPTSTAMQICKDESRGIADAINWADSHKNKAGEVICESSQGLYQIACMWPDKLGYTMEDLLIPEKNIEMAYKLWSKEGFYPWTTYKHGPNVVK